MAAHRNQLTCVTSDGSTWLQVLARYIWAIKLATRNGFVVLADNHLNSDPTVVNNVTFWLQARSLRCYLTARVAAHLLLA